VAGLLATMMMPGLAHAAFSPLGDDVEGGLPPRAIAQARTTSQVAPIQLAQADDTTFRVGQLEEQIRGLNGRIEELSFQLLEMQERMRQMQEDNEFRFQEIEGGASGNRTDTGNLAPSDGNQNAAVADPVTEPPADQTDTSLGTITFDQNGEMVAPAEEPQDGTQDDTLTASLPAAGSEELYRAAYGYVLSGDYRLAQTAFENYIAQYPDAARLPDAHFWLGEAQYSQGEYHEAAKTLLTAHKQFPNSPKSPEMLLKLGMSLAALDNRDTACATYREVLTRYPQSSDAVKSKVAIEQSRMSC
jgi:tol-pal system protein YbgF